jgi:hypothetical protein
MNRVKAADDLELRQVMIEAVVGFADQNDSLVGERGNQTLQI